MAEDRGAFKTNRAKSRQILVVVIPGTPLPTSLTAQESLLCWRFGHSFADL